MASLRPNRRQVPPRGLRGAGPVGATPLSLPRPSPMPAASTERPSEPRAAPPERGLPARPRESAEAVLRRLQQRFARETRLSADAHAPVRDAAFHQWLGRASGMLPGKLEWVRPELADLGLLPLQEGRERLCIALRGAEPVVGLVLADPFDRDTRLWLEARVRAAGRPPTRWYVAPAPDVLAFYDRLEQWQAAALPAKDAAAGEPADAPAGTATALPAALPDAGAGAPRAAAAVPGRGSPRVRPAHPAASGARAGATLPAAPAAAPAPAREDDAPARRFVERSLQQALQAGASDVHLSSTPEGLLVRQRIDGVLHWADQADGREFAAQVMRRLKVLADLDPALSGRVQDGRLRLVHEEREVEARLSLLPGRHGEDAVLRRLDRQPLADPGALNVAALDFDPIPAAAMRRLARIPHGLLLVTGPRGSGSSSTLYGLLGESPPGEDRLITLEDPVEAPLPHALQIAIDESAGLGWARALRAALRHDPDRLMLGELPDAATARLAVQAALGGQRLYAALHASQAFDAIGRLITLGVDPWDLAAGLNGVVAQRLLRRLCEHCAEPCEPDAALLAASGLSRAVLDEGWQFRRAVGCPHCRGTGYRGRVPIAQVLTLDLELRSLIARRAPPSAQREAAERTGLTTLREAALERVSQGLTPLEEANRVTSVQE